MLAIHPQPAAILCNPGYGNAPSLRCAEVALRVREYLRASGWKSVRIIIPLLYGERQQRLLEEECGAYIDVVYDETLGGLLGELLYDGQSYGAFLKRWLDGVDDVSRRAQRYIAATYEGEIHMEIGRVPLMETGIRPACVLGFTKLSELYDRASREEAVHIDRRLLLAAAERMRYLESRYDASFFTEPGTFRAAREDIVIPPIAALHPVEMAVPKPSVYVTVSGIPGMEKYAVFAPMLGMPVYSNRPERIAGALYAPPGILLHPNIVLHVARAGWGAIWSSLLSATPLITAPYDPSDDPEILFNNRRVEELKLGILYRGQTPADLLKAAHALEPGIVEYRNALHQRFGTLDGAAEAARKIAEEIFPPAESPIDYHHGEIDR